MNYKIKNINWLQTILMDLPDANSVTVQVFTRAGSVYEDASNNGISHFLEHMFFKWWRKYTNSLEVARVVDSIGGEFNAYTAKDIASYYVKSAPQYIYKSMDVLSDMLIHSTFPEEELEIEKWVVIQEMKMSNDNPQRLMHKQATSRIYGDNSYGRPIIWSEETVMNITRQNLLDRKNKLYNKNNLVLVIAGKLPAEEELINNISTYFADLQNWEWFTKPNYDFNNLIINKQESKTAFYDKWTEQNHLVIWYTWPYRDSDDISMQRKFYAMKLAMIAFGANMSSRLFQEIREKRWLCYYIHAWAYSSTVDKLWTIQITAWLDKDKRDEAITAIYEQINMLGRDGITSEEFEMAKWYKLWWLQMWIETTDQRAEFLWPDYITEGKIRDIEYIYNLYNSISLDEVNEITKWLKHEDFYLYYIK